MPVATLARGARTSVAPAKMPRLAVCAYCSTEYVFGPGCAAGVPAHLFPHDGLISVQSIAGASGSASEPVGGEGNAIPCPKCYCYQPSVFGPMALKQYGWVRLFYLPAALAAVLGLALAVLADKPATRLVGSVVGMLGVGGLWATGRVQKMLIDGYDANVRPEWERAALAGEKAVLLTDFKRTAAEQAEAAYRAHLVNTGGQSADAYVIEVWFKPEEITPGAAVHVSLPNGKKGEFVLEQPVAAGNTYPVHSEWGEDLPFAARTCIFNRVA